MKLSYIILWVLFVCALIGILWRLFSRRASLPCPVWLRWMVEIDNPFTKTNKASVIIEHLDLKAGMNVLDAGCGPGRLTIPMAEKVGSQGMVTALDMQSGMLDRVQQKAQSANVKNIQLLLAKLGEGKLGKNQYDRAVLVNVLGEIPDRMAALQEIFSALKPGGILSITEVIFDPHFQSKNTVRQLALDANFHVKEIFGGRFAYTMHVEKPK